MPQLAAAPAAFGHEGVEVKDSRTRWIIGTAVAASCGGTVLAAVMELEIHWYMAVVLASAMISGGAFAYGVDARAKKRDAARREIEHARRAAEKTAIEDAVRRVCKAIDNNARRFEEAASSHAVRMEEVTRGHGEQLRSDVFTVERLLANMQRGEVLAHIDAALEAEARNPHTDSGPFPVVR